MQTLPLPLLVATKLETVPRRGGSVRSPALALVTGLQLGVTVSVHLLGPLGLVRSKNRLRTTKHLEK